MTLRAAADREGELQSSGVDTATGTDSASSLLSEAVRTCLETDNALEASRQVDVRERDALRGAVGAQYSFAFISADNACRDLTSASATSEHKRNRTRQVTTREKKGLLHAEFDQYDLDLQE